MPPQFWCQNKAMAWMNGCIPIKFMLWLFKDENTPGAYHVQLCTVYKNYINYQSNRCNLVSIVLFAYTLQCSSYVHYNLFNYLLHKLIAAIWREGSSFCLAGTTCKQWMKILWISLSKVLGTKTKAIYQNANIWPSSEGFMHITKVVLYIYNYVEYIIMVSIWTAKDWGGKVRKSPKKL